jgi:hypothetical protein
VLSLEDVPQSLLKAATPPIAWLLRGGARGFGMCAGQVWMTPLMT